MVIKMVLVRRGGKSNIRVNFIGISADGARSEVRTPSKPYLPCRANARSHRCNRKGLPRFPGGWRFEAVGQRVPQVWFDMPCAVGDGVPQAWAVSGPRRAIKKATCETSQLAWSV